jgi:hypothetical protein
MALGAAGLVLSFLSHLAGWTGVYGPLGRWTWLLHLGLFAVFLPAVAVSPRVQAGEKTDSLEVALCGCPPWMKRMVYVFFGYAIVHFLAFAVSMVLSGPEVRGPGMPPIVVRGFSGHWMAFYAAALGMLYGALHRDRVRAH